MNTRTPRDPQNYSVQGQPGGHPQKAASAGPDSTAVPALHLNTITYCRPQCTHTTSAVMIGSHYSPLCERGADPLSRPPSSRLLGVLSWMTNIASRAYGPVQNRASSLFIRGIDCTVRVPPNVGIRINHLPTITYETLFHRQSKALSAVSHWRSSQPRVQNINHRFLSASNLFANMAKSSSGDALGTAPSFPSFPPSSSVGGMSGSFGVLSPAANFSVMRGVTMSLAASAVPS